MQEKAGNIILGIAGSAERFTIKYGWLKFKLSIKPLTAKQLIEISKEVSKIGYVKESDDLFASMLAGIEDATYIARIIAIATRVRFRRIVVKAVLNLPLSDIQTLFKIVYMQSDPTPYFFFTVLAKGRMNLLKPTEPSSEEKVSSAE